MTEPRPRDERRSERSRTRRAVLLGALGVVTLPGCAQQTGAGQPTTDAGGDGTTTARSTGQGPTLTAGGNGTTADPTAGQPTSTSTASGTGTSATVGTAGPVLTSPIRLGGDVTGWMGQEPAAIRGVTNPTLRLAAGEEYELVWENLDGLEHEMKFVDGTGEDLAESESAEDRGATVTMTFTASPALTEYYCEYHPQSMRGDVVVVDG